MIGLNPLQIQLYEAAKAWDERHLDEPFVVELQDLLQWSRRDLSRLLHGCIQKGYLAFDDDGKVIANEPPHERAMRLVCEETGFSADEVTGPSQSIRLSTARKVVAHRLKAVGYGLADIALVVNRHPSSVAGYFEEPRFHGDPRVRSEGSPSCTA